jgi:hypothetical protein
LYQHLKKSVNFKKDEFESLKGMNAFNSLSTIVKSIELELNSLDKKLRPTIQLISIKNTIKSKLTEMKPQNTALNELNEHFQSIRRIIGDESLKKEEKIIQMSEKYSTLFKNNQPQTSYSKRTDITSKQAKYDIKNENILCQWCRLWDSHKDDLFFYYDIEGLEKTNIYNEQLFSILKRRVVQAHGQAHKDYMVLTRGDLYLKDICQKNTQNVHEILTRYDLKELTRLREPLQKKIDHERAYFRNSKILNELISQIAQNIREKTWEIEKNMI